MDQKFLEGIEFIHDRFTETHAWWLYGIVKSLRPVVVVETGTCHGFITAFLAKALQECGGGAKVISIDYYSESWPHADPNSMKKVQENLDRCGVLDSVELVAGEAVKTLEHLAATGKLNHLGVAIFDDTHTYQQVKREIDIVAPHLVDFGVVGGHDCWNADFMGVNQAYKEAALQYGYRSMWSVHSCGYVLMQKPAPGM